MARLQARAYPVIQRYQHVTSRVRRWLIRCIVLAMTSVFPTTTTTMQVSLDRTQCQSLLYLTSINQHIYRL
jgi:hypothetical protein